MKKKTIIGLTILVSVLTINALSQVVLKAPVQPVSTTYTATLTAEQKAYAITALSAVVRLPTNTVSTNIRQFKGVVNRDGTVTLTVVVSAN
jgi:hypothetical protein